MTKPDLFRCRCAVSCTERATQEDMRCDTCRQDNHLHIGTIATDNPMSPFLCEPLHIRWGSR